MEESDVSRASNLLNRIQSWTEEDWLLLRHHYPEDVARFAALLRDGPPRESEKTTPEFVEDPRPSSDSQSARDLVWGFATQFEHMTAMQASARLDVVLGLLTEKLGRDL